MSLKISQKAITLVSPCETCPSKARLEATATHLKTGSERIARNADDIWSRTTATIQPAETALLDPNIDPARKANIEQKQEYVFDSSARLIRVSGEIKGLVDATLAEAEEVVCDTSQTDPQSCPKLSVLFGAVEPMAILVNELR